MKYSVFDIWRVPSGWIFGCDAAGAISFTFVPFEVPNF